MKTIINLYLIYLRAGNGILGSARIALKTLRSKK
jgi:hypothetical protein